MKFRVLWDDYMAVHDDGDFVHYVSRCAAVILYCFAFLLQLQCFLFNLLSKNESRLIKSPVCLSVSPPLITFELLGRIS
jgi:hypothetical protein